MGTRSLSILALALTVLAAPPKGVAQAPAQTSVIAEIHATGSHRYTDAQVAAASGLKAGQTVTRDDLQAAADRLSELGPFASVRYHYTSRENSVSVEFEVQDAPTVQVSFDNFPWFTDAELSQALQEGVALFDGTAPEQGAILDTMSEILSKLLSSQGIHATVERLLIAQPSGEGMMQQFHAVGADLKIGAIEFQTTPPLEDRRTNAALEDLLGKPYSRFTVDVFAYEQVRPLYLERGHLRVRFGKPMARFTGDPNKPLADRVLVIVPIDPGPIFRWGGAEWSGNGAFGPAALNEYLGLKVNELADGMKIEKAWGRVRAEYSRRGYLDVKVEPEPVFDGAEQRVAYRVSVTEGPQYRMGEMIITGLSLDAERKVGEAWHIERGAVFDAAYFEEFLKAGVKQALADLPVHYDEIGRWLRTNPATKTVDVLLDFK